MNSDYVIAASVLAVCVVAVVYFTWRLWLPYPSKRRWVNRTSVPDSALDIAWATAQLQLAGQPIELNAVGGISHVIAPDGRALWTDPHWVTVIEVPLNPDGETINPPFNVAIKCTMASKCQKWAIVAAPKVHLASGAVSYEFENVILERLGYDVSGR